MKRPPLVIVALLLLLATRRLAIEPLTRTLALCTIVVIPLATLGRFLWRRARIRGLSTRLGAALTSSLATGLLAALAGLTIVGAAGAMHATRPALHATYTPERFAASPAIVEQRGFYPTEADTAGNRYAWTQERATLVFDFLVRKPLTLTFDLRSAAVAGGPATPVQVTVNGRDAGTLQPDPKNPSFQPLSLRVTPFDWGGQRTEIRLVPTAFHPGSGDSRLLGTMVQGVTVDKTEAWSSLGRRMWLLWFLPALAAVVIGLSCAARRYRSSLAGYGAIAVCLAGAADAALILVLLLRIGFIAPETFPVWLSGAASIGLCFTIAAVLLPLGRPEAASIARRMRMWPARHRIGTRVRGAVASLLRPDAATRAVTRRDLARDLALLFVIALGVRLIWVLVIPPWQAPDEPEHFIYAKHIVEQKEIPHPPYPNYPFYAKEDTTSWDYTLFGDLSTVVSGNPEQTLPYLPFVYDYSTARSYQAPSEDRFTNAGARATNYPPLYYLVEAIPYALFKNGPVLSRLYAVRSMSAVMGALSCAFAYLIAYEARRTRRWGWSLGLCMAFMPMYVFITATANNDVAMDLCATALIWLTVRIYRRRAISLRLACAVGGASALTLLTKPNIIPIVGVAGVIMLLAVLPAMRQSWERARSGARALGAYAAAGIAVYGPYALFRLRNFGNIGLSMAPVLNFVHSLTGMSAVRAADSAATASPLLLSLARVSPWEYLLSLKARGWDYYQWLFVTAFWGDFGWLDVSIPPRYYLFITAACIIGGIGIAIQIILQPRRRAMTLLLLGLIAAQVGFLFLSDYYLSYVKANSALGLQGRYFFPILAPLLFLLLAGWEHLFREHPAALRLGVLFMLWLQLVSLGTMFARYYGVSIG